MEQQFITKRIATLEEEIHKLKTLAHAPLKKHPVSLKGLFKGLHFTEQEMQDAKKSVFKHL